MQPKSSLPLSILHRAYPSQRIMRAVVVVVPDPLVCDLPHLIQRIKCIGIQYGLPIGPVKTLDQGILSGFTGLNVLECDAVDLAPLLSQLGDKFWSIIHSDARWFSVFVDQMVEHPDDPAAFEAIIRLDVENFPVEIIDDIERAKFSTATQRIAHEVHAPALGKPHGDDDGLFHPCRKALFDLPTQGEPHLLIHPVKALVVDPLTRMAKAVVALPKPFPRVRFAQANQLRYQRPIILLGYVVQTAPTGL